MTSKVIRVDEEVYQRLKTIAAAAGSHPLRRIPYCAMDHLVKRYQRSRK